MPPIKAYSYIRLSSKKQLQGDGETRQIELRDMFVAKHGLELDDTIRDLGVSAFDRSNIEKGALGKFLRKVKAGEIAKGSYLLVENLDRLSRDHVFGALGVFHDLLEAGIVIAALGDGGRIYSMESINQNWTELIISLTVMSRAHEESLRKVETLRGVWVRKRADRSRKLTRKCPTWLTVTEDGTDFIVDEERVELIKGMLRDLAGGIGRDKIARRLNADGELPWGHGREWHGGTVTKFTDNEALIGRFQPCTVERKIVDGVRVERRIPVGEPIEDYYPKVISDELWINARKAADKVARLGKGNAGGRRGTIFTNLFSGLAVCDACESPMNYRDRGPRSTPCLRCSGNRNGTCGNESRPRYLPLERTVLSWAILSDKPPHQDGAAENEALATAELLRDQAAAVVERLIIAIEQGASLDGRLVQRQVELAQAEEAVVAARRAARAAIPTSSPEQRCGILAAVERSRDLPDKERFEARAAAAQELRDLFTEIRCHADGSVTVWTGDWGFRIHMKGDEAWIEGGGEIEPGKSLALRWETRDGVVSQPFLPFSVTISESE